jgi:hypothetical protein
MYPRYIDEGIRPRAGVSLNGERIAGDFRIDSLGVSLILRALSIGTVDSQGVSRSCL